MDKISKAISLIESGRLFSYNNEDLDSIVWHDLDTKQPIPKADIQTKISEIEQQEIDNKANGNQKLLDLGLTQAEATALTGYTPPVE